MNGEREKNAQIQATLLPIHVTEDCWDILLLLGTKMAHGIFKDELQFGVEVLCSVTIVDEKNYMLVTAVLQANMGEDLVVLGQHTLFLMWTQREQRCAIRIFFCVASFCCGPLSSHFVVKSTTPFWLCFLSLMGGRPST